MVNIQREGRYTVIHKGNVISLIAAAPHWGTVKDSRGKVLGYMFVGRFYMEET